jgi:hypothetical protein
MCKKGIYMINSNTQPDTLSMVPPSEIRDEVQGFSYNALAALGPNYLIKAWLPKKGPAFVALIQAMRAHIFYNFETRQQQTKYFPEAATIAKMCGISRAKVFRLLNDPDMPRFIRREKQRRWDKVMHKEVTTSNRYYVALDDPPTPEDEHLVREAQERLAHITAHDNAILDDDRPARRPKAQRSEYQNETLIAVSERDSDSSIKLRQEDRISKTNIYEGFTSIRESEAGEAEAIRIADRTGRGTKDAAIRNEIEQERDQVKIRAKQIESDRKVLATCRADGVPTLPAEAMLSETEAWRVDARVAAAGIIASNLVQLGGSGPADAIERVLSAHASYRTPAEILAKLADIARDRTNNRAGHIDDDAMPGYFISTLCNMASEARRKHYDVAALRKTAAKAARKEQIAQGLPVTPPQRSYTSPQPPSSRIRATGRTAQAEDYYDRFKPGVQV